MSGGGLKATCGVKVGTRVGWLESPVARVGKEETKEARGREGAVG